MTSRLKLLTLTALGVLGIAAMVGIPSTQARGYMSDPAVQKALADQDYSAFDQAITEYASRRMHNIDAQQSDRMTLHHQKREDLRKAIEANDYEAFQSLAGQRLKTRIDTPEKFDQLVKLHQANQTRRTQITEAIKNNDFEAFKTALTTDPSNPNQPVTPTASEELLRQRFNQLRDYYLQHGELPLIRLNYQGGFLHTRDGFQHSYQQSHSTL